MPKVDLTIVILSYNVEKLLQDCLSSLLNSYTDSDSWHIVVVDNASSDNSVVMVRKKFPRVEVIETGKNLGFAGGNNVALKKITSPYTLLLNPDTIVYPKTIQTVLQFIKAHSDVGAATCRVEFPDGSLDYSCHRRFPTPWNSYLHFYSFFFKKLSAYSNSSIPADIHEIDALTGAFALIRTSAGRQINWFDEDYFWNGEDLDFCYRLKENGWKIVYLPQVKITHFKGSSSGIRKTGRGHASRATKIRITLSATTAMRLFYQKHLEKKYPAPLNWLVYIGIAFLRLLRLTQAYLFLQ